MRERERKGEEGAMKEKKENAERERQADRQI